MGSIHQKLVSDSLKFLELHCIMRGSYLNILSFSIGFSAIKKKSNAVYILFREANIHIRSLLCSNTSGDKAALRFEPQN